MRVDLRRVPFYWLNVDARVDRRRHMIEQLHGFIHDRVDGSPSPLLPPNNDDLGHYVGAPLGHARVIDHALRRMGNTFAPFVLCEDDIAWSVPPRPGPVIVEFPEHAAAVYLGISACGVRPEVNDYVMDIVREQSQEYPQLQRVFNMLTAHAVLFTSMRYTMAYFAAMIESCATREPCDCISARLMAMHEVFARGEPMFYQHGAVGGQEAMTKIAWTDSGHGGVGGAQRGREYHQMHPYCTLLNGPTREAITTVTLVLCIEDVMNWRSAATTRSVVCVDQMRHPQLYELIKDQIPYARVLLTDELDPRELVRLARAVNPFNTRGFAFRWRPGAEIVTSVDSEP